MIGIRADANKKIATGHVMRCITIARRLSEAGEKVTFYASDRESEEVFLLYSSDIAGAEIVVLGSDYTDMEGELPALKKELLKRDTSFLLVDSYFVTYSYFRELKRVCPTAYIDDLGKEPYPVDILINYSGYYRELGYEKMYMGMTGFYGNPTRFLMGLKYAPLRDAFIRTVKEEGEAFRDKKEGSGIFRGDSCLTDGRRRILLAAGGGDTQKMIMALLHGAEERELLDIYTFNVVVGNFVENKEEIKSFANEHESVIVHQNVTDMAGLMRECDLAVAAAGTMLTECAAIGLPAVFYQVADNQKFNVEFWNKTGGMHFAGDVTDGAAAKKREVVDKIFREVRLILSDGSRLHEMRSALFEVTDGRGAERIAGALTGKDE